MAPTKVGAFILSNIIINLPISVPVTKKKDRGLNLNYYRNDHFQLLNNMKIKFEEIVTPLLINVPKLKYTKLRYTLFYGSKHKVDLSNICCIVDKFFCDTIVNNGILEDDNIDFINQSIYDWGGVDKNNPRVEVTFYDYKELEEQPMQIILTEEEIKSALNSYIFHQLTIKPNQKIDITFDTNESTDELFSIVNITNIVNTIIEPTTKPNYPPDARGVIGTETQLPSFGALQSHLPTEVGERAAVSDSAPEASEEVIEAPFQVGSDTETTSPVATENPVPSKRLFGNLTKPVNPK